MSSTGLRRVLTALLAVAIVAAALPAAQARAAAYVVRNNADSGPGSLREAILAANASAGPDTISFSIPTVNSSPPVISLLTALPDITDPLTIDGTTQLEKWVVLDGSALTSSAAQSGLELAAGGSLVRGLVIKRFPGAGIRISGPGGNTVAGNRIGHDANAQGFWVPQPNGGSGVLISGSPSNTIGGIVAADRNILSGNGGAGATVEVSGADTNSILGNYIGLGPDGTSDVRNDLGGVRIASAGNVVRGNVISANNLVGTESHGVVLDGATARGNVVAGNLIGPRADGTAGPPNVGVGVLIRSGASSNLVGGAVPADRNVISNNRSHGVHIAGAASAGNLVEGNYIGVGPDGDTAMPNGTPDASPPSAGVLLSDTGGAGGHRIKNNVISANIAYGVSLLRTSGAQEVSYNVIGLAADGLTKRSNTSVGLNVYLGETPQTAAHSIIGNTVSGNTVHGMYLYGVAGATVASNRIGQAATGSTLVGNGGDGIVLLHSADNAITGNLIAGNAGAGIALAVDTARNQMFDNRIRSNRAGVVLSGVTSVANGILKGSITGHGAGGGIELALGANAGIAPPTITSFTNGNAIVVSGAGARPGALIQVYADPGSEGRDYLGQTTATETGSWTTSAWEYPDMVAIAAAVRAGTLKLHATQTDVAGNTSQLSQGVPPPAVLNRKNHGWLTALPITGGVPVSDQISRDGQATWYRLPITPQTQVTIDVTGCTFDCNLIVYRDLYQVATALGAGSTSLTTIRADLAGNIAADDMDADDMDADDMDAGNTAADDMDADDMDADDMDADDMDADDMDADDMDADDMDAADPRLATYGPAYLAAQRKGIRAASVHEGLAPEQVSINTRSLTGDLFIRVRGDTLRDKGLFTVSASLAPQASCVGAALTPRDPSTAAAALTGGARSLILTDTSAYPAAERAALVSKLGQLAAHPTVRGYVFDLAADANIAALRADWLGKPTCVVQANLLTDAIRELVRRARVASPIEYLIIGGGDRVVPSHREPDWAEISRESKYSPPVTGASASDASLVSDTILTDDFYATGTPIERVNRTLYLPDIAVGRLVESVADISAYVEMYLAQNGRAAPTRALSSGYDFNLDLAQDVSAQLTARSVVVNSTLSSNSWTSTDWRNTVLNTPLAQRFGILSLQGHFSANRLVPADNGQRILSTEIAGVTDGRFRGALVYSLGCHSGYSIVDADALQGLTQPVAFPEAFVRQGATLVGGTGYQYGETVLLKNSEALMSLLTTELGYSNDAAGASYGPAGVPIGKALMYAKRAYMGQTATPRGIDFKVVGVSTVFGSPTMSFALPATVARPTATTVVPSPVSGFGGLGVLDATRATGLTRNGAPGSPSYYDAAGATTIAPFRPIAPLITVPAQAAGSVLAGVVFMGGTYAEEAGFVPRLSLPATELGGAAPAYVNDTFVPTRPVRTNLFDRDAIQLIPFQYRSDASGAAGIARVYGDVHYRAYYSSVTGAAAIVDAPPIEQVSVSVVPTGIEVRASVRGHTLAGIADVYVTYTDTSAAARSFASVQMTAGATVSDGPGFSGFTREYTAIIPAGANAAAIRFMVQAVSGTGRVEVAANGGQLFSIRTGTAAAAPAPTVPPAATTLTLTAAPQSPAYRSSVTGTATLSGLAADKLAGRPIAFTFGGSTKTVATSSSGVASATFDVLAAPGPRALTASYAGASDALGSAGSVVVQVQRAVATLLVTPAALRPPDGAVIARLVAGGVALNEQPIILRVGSRSIATETDFAGNVRFETLDFPATAGPLDVGVEYPGSQRYLPASATVTVAVYDPRTFVSAGGWLETAGATGIPAGVRANVTFEARYQPGRTRPNGNLLVQAGSTFTFRATTTEWLRVVDDGAAVAGEGTLNGKAGYRFLIEATDAASDTVSVRIWDATGSAAAPTHAIAGTLRGGNVEIHR